MRNHPLAGRPARAAALALLLVPAAASADLLFLKDGFVLQGKVRRESVTEFDPVGKEPVIIPKGFFLLDDGPRRIYFSPTQVRIVEKMPDPVEERVVLKSGAMILKPLNLPPLLEVTDPGEWDAKWQRTYTFRSTARSYKVRHHLGLLTPSWFRADAATTFFWSAAYLTREMEPATALRLLRSHPEFVEDKTLKPPQVAARRLRLCDFLAQAGWFDLAEKELDRLLKDVPEQKDRVAAAKVALDKMRTRERWEQVKRWHHAGRHRAARHGVADFPEKYATEQMRSDLRALRARYHRTVTRTEEAHKHLAACAKEVTEAKHKPLAEAAAVIRKELHYDNVERLDAFLGQAAQAERLKARAKKPALGPAELLALAASGWLLGGPSAESSPQVALSLWKTRALVLDYQKKDTAAGRRELLDAYLKEVSPRVEVDEVAQLIPTLPPADAAPPKQTGTTEMSCMVGSGANATSYRLKLPPEYTHNRPYPVLLVLHQAGEKASAMVERWQAAAAENGYLLAAPEWEQGLAGHYGYSEREHAAVLETLRDLRRRYRVDDDRVFLFGLGEGGKMAFDVGLQYPDRFAGVMPMGAGPELFAARCWRNAQALPLYVVNGTKAGESTKQLRTAFEQWVIRGYPALWVEYKGRGVEWFAGEVPNLFDWMAMQKRAFPLKQLGTAGFGGPFGNEYCTLRPGENRFWWLSADEVYERNTTTPRRWNNAAVPAALTGSVGDEGNSITVKTSGVKKLTLWLGRNAQGQTMIDFDKPVAVTVNTTKLIPKAVTPSLGVLLEDLYQRGDRQQLFLAKLELKP